MAFSSLYLPIYRPLSVSLCLSQSVIQSVTLSIFLSAYMYECLSVSHPSIHLPACLSLIHLSTCLFVCLSTIYPSKYLRLSILFFSFLSIHLHIPYILLYLPTMYTSISGIFPLYPPRSQVQLCVRVWVWVHQRPSHLVSSTRIHVTDAFSPCQPAIRTGLTNTCGPVVYLSITHMSMAVIHNTYPPTTCLKIALDKHSVAQFSLPVKYKKKYVSHDVKRNTKY